VTAPQVAHFENRFPALPSVLDRLREQREDAAVLAERASDGDLSYLRCARIKCASAADSDRYAGSLVSTPFAVAAVEEVLWER